VAHPTPRDPADHILATDEEREQNFDVLESEPAGNGKSAHLR
jgi:hypothetical protein